MIGETVDGRYRILRELGVGGMGAVYEAEHVGTGRHVAVKVILDAGLAKHADVIKRFQLEARAAGAIDTQHIVQILDTGIDSKSGAPYMAMELLRGEDLDQLVERVGVLPPSLALRIVGQACRGLIKAHEAGVIHRDIKPANVFLARREDGEIVVKLLDFGIAKMKQDASGPVDTSLTRTGNVLGSPLYMSPEQATGLKTIDHRTDVWSIGVVLYEALTGKSPHGDAETVGLLILRICSYPAPPVQDLAPWVAPEIAAIAHGALRREVDARFATVTEMVEAITRVLPQGFSVRADELAGLTLVERSAVAPRLSMTEAGLRDSGGIVGAGGPYAAPASLSSWGPRGSGPPGSSTVAGLSHAPSNHAAEKKLSTTRLALLVAAAIVLVGSAVAYKMRAPGTDGAPTAEANPAKVDSPTPPAAASPPASAPIVTAGSAVDRVVRVAIEPPGATAEVDGRETPVTDGAIDVKGELGSEHSVRVRHGGRETSARVVIAASGAVPAKVELRALATGPGKPPIAAPTSQPTPAVPTTKPTTKPKGPGVTREFE